MIDLIAKFLLVTIGILPYAYVYAKAEREPTGSLAESWYSGGLGICILTALALLYHYFEKLIDFIIEPGGIWFKSFVFYLCVSVIILVIFTIRMTQIKIELKDKTIHRQSEEIRKLKEEIYKLTND
tara:strand:- start:1681 stop:2058 length:378 start_codon:yes stop_codon:yes gene_type:complete